MLVEGIFIAVVVIVGIASLYMVMGSQYKIIDTFNSITREERESGQEDVDLNINDKGKVYIKNKSPTPVKIVEMRILDKDGNLVITCPVDVSFSGGKEIPIADIVHQGINSTFTTNISDPLIDSNAVAEITKCMDDFITN